MRTTYYEDDNFKVQYRIVDGVVFLHCHVFEWKPSVFKNIIKVFGELQNYMQSRGVDAIYTITPNPKFAKLLGGKYLGDYSEEDFEYEVFKWDLTL